MPKRHITPHKGGRTARLPSVRLSPNTLAALNDICAALDLSVADWTTLHITSDAMQLEDVRERDESITPRAVMRLGRMRPFAVDIMAIADGLDSDQLDAIEDDCIRRGVLPCTPDDWRIQIDLHTLKPG